MEKEVDKEQINQLPLIEFQGPIHVVTTDSQVETMIQQLQGVDQIGFDTEAKPSFRRGENHPTCLVQLATDTEAWIVRLRRKVPKPLVELLADPAATKVGLGLRDDLRDLQSLAPFEPASFVDVSTLATEADIPRPGLRHLAALLLGHRINKGQQTSNWEAKKLSNKQLTYAATDAWLPLKIYEALQERGWA